uniref:Uncharacterized protein n=1 Tax=Arundo donax TaxID=35708 RepID=A0A0A9DCH9_ARUDO
MVGRRRVKMVVSCRGHRRRPEVEATKNLEMVFPGPEGGSLVSSAWMAFLVRRVSWAWMILVCPEPSVWMAILVRRESSV